MKKESIILIIMSIIIIFFTMKANFGYKVTVSQEIKQIGFESKKEKSFPKVTKVIFSPWVVPKPVEAPKPVVMPKPELPKADPHEGFRRVLARYQLLGFTGEGSLREALISKGDELKNIKINETIEDDLYLKEFIQSGIIISSKSDSTFVEKLNVKE